MDRTILVQDSTAEDRDAYSDTTQVVPVPDDAAAASVEAEEVGSGAWVVVGMSIEEDGVAAGRVVFTSVVWIVGESLGRAVDTPGRGREVLVITWPVDVAPD